MNVGALHEGVVSEFDEERGVGTVRGDDGAAYSFHCTQIADGTRSIGPGARVVFVCVPGHLGRLEAAGLAAIEPMSRSRR